MRYINAASHYYANQYTDDYATGSYPNFNTQYYSLPNASNVEWLKFRRFYRSVPKGSWAVRTATDVYSCNHDTEHFAHARKVHFNHL